MGRGALGVAQRPVPLRSGIAAFSIGCGRQVAEATMRSDGVVVVLPNRQNLASMGKRCEQCLVQTFIAQPAEEGFHERILLRLARGNVMPLDLHLLRPAQDRLARQLGTIVRDGHGGPPPRGTTPSWFT